MYIECDALLLPFGTNTQRKTHLNTDSQVTFAHFSPHKKKNVFHAVFVLGSTSVKLSEKRKQIHFLTSTRVHHVIDPSSSTRRKSRVCAVISVVFLFPLLPNCIPGGLYH